MRGRGFVWVGVAVVLSFLLTSCGGGGNGNASPRIDSPVIATASLPDGGVSVAYSATLTASGGTAPYSWSIFSGTLPAGVTLDGNTGIIAGTPTAAGKSSFVVEMKDSEATPVAVQAPFSITVHPQLVITTGALPIGLQNTAYQATVAGSGGVAPYSWSVVSGSLPTGVTLNSSTGTIAGTPTSAGTLSFTVQAQDSQTKPATAQASLSITIDGPLGVTTTQLSTAVQGVPYNTTLTASGGLPPYTWTIASSSLPPGLSFSNSGTISGIPTDAGNFNFTVQVTDAEPATTNATLTLGVAATPQGAITTQHNDTFRTGQNINETILTPANVNVGSFGKLFSYPVDGYIYAQPLYLPDVDIPGNGIHNVVYVVTEHDSIYAFDADSNAGGNQTPLWHTSLINPQNGITTISSQDVNCLAITPEIGITSTPVIDGSTNTIYLLAETKENGNFFHRLHALDITTGTEKNGSPVTISAQVPGTGEGSSGGVITFDPLMHLNRPGLLLSNGTIYIAWSSNCDTTPFHGWVMGYNKTTLQQTAVWNTTANAGFGGIWMSGGGIAADISGNLFIPTGNGTFDTSGHPVDFGDSIVKIAAAGDSFTPSDYFTPYDQGNLDASDEDVGAGAVLLLPDQAGAHVHELIQSGKEGSIYVVDRDNMGHFNPNDNSQIIQNITGQIGGLYSTPTYWNGSVYFGASYDTLKAFSLTNGLLSTTPTSRSDVTFLFPGPTPSISANGDTDAIIWALQTDATLNEGNEVLYAFDATNLSHELYDSTQNSQRDTVGGAVKFATPTIANGKVYVGAAQQLSVFGNILAAAATPTFSPAWGTYTSSQTVSLSDITPGATIHYTTDGSSPTIFSPVYTSPITISVTTTVKAIASATGYNNSSIGTAVYTITTGGGGSLNYGSGFTGSGLAINGTGQIDGSHLRLTDGGVGEITAAWYTTPLSIRTFTQDFNFKVVNAVGDGFTFTIQNAGAAAIGPGGAGLGYGAPSPGGSGGIPNSLAVKFDLYNNFGEGNDSTGLYTEGTSPTVPTIDMTSSGVNLHSGDIFNVHMTYDGTTLTMIITDTVTYSSFT
jgi:hypothetical protein